MTLTLGITDAEITRLIGEVDKLGIDVPLGWPIAFAEAVSAHSRLGTWPASYQHAIIHAYRYRRTDIHTRHTLASRGRRSARNAAGSWGPEFLSISSGWESAHLRTASEKLSLSLAGGSARRSAPVGVNRLMSTLFRLD